MVIREMLLAVSTPISALIVKCVQDAIGRLHAHIIERLEELEKQLASTPKATHTHTHRRAPLPVICGALTVK